MNTTEHAANIRAILKSKHMITSRQVSVRADHFSMGSSINVTIKDPNLSHDMIANIANEAESIRRCEYSGEILSGGNRYVSVGYSREALAVIAARWSNEVERAALELSQASENSLVMIPGTTLRLGNGTNHFPGTFGVWSDKGHLQQCYGLDDVAQVVGTYMNNSQVAR